MTYLIGTDEAGYGPNLGPLVVSATVWQVDGNERGEALYDRMDSCATHRAPDVCRKGVGLFADSKNLYKSRGRLTALERGVLASLAVADQAEDVATHITTWRKLWQRLAPEGLEQLERVPWYRDFDTRLPCDASEVEIQQAWQGLRARLQAAGLTILELQTCVVFPQRFNDAIDRYGSKGEALSQWTLALVSRLVEPLGEAPILVHCDKHGGRARYQRLLQQAFPNQLVEVRLETRLQSIYQLGPRKRRIEVRFVAKGEQFQPTALASMTAKLLRELAMLAFNQFWSQHVPDLRPTAGYPLDAKRFRREIGDAQRSLDIPDRQLWRNR